VPVRPDCIHRSDRHQRADDAEEGQIHRPRLPAYSRHETKDRAQGLDPPGRRAPLRKIAGMEPVDDPVEVEDRWQSACRVRADSSPRSVRTWPP
jgi:hypothetical protein